MAEAVKVQDVRDSLEEVPGLQMPASLTDSKVQTVIRRNTAKVLALRGLDDLPATGSNERDLIDDAVLKLSSLDLRMMMRPDEADFLRAMAEQAREVRIGIEVVEKSSAQTGTRFVAVGGQEDYELG